jgi:hypothetical protein
MAAFLAQNPYYGGVPEKSDTYTTAADWVSAWEQVKAA